MAWQVPRKISSWNVPMPCTVRNRTIRAWLGRLAPAWFKGFHRNFMDFFRISWREWQSSMDFSWDFIGMIKMGWLLWDFRIFHGIFHGDSMGFKILFLSIDLGNLLIYRIKDSIYGIGWYPSVQWIASRVSTLETIHIFYHENKFGCPAVPQSYPKNKSNGCLQGLCEQHYRYGYLNNGYGMSTWLFIDMSIVHLIRCVTSSKQWMNEVWSSIPSFAISQNGYIKPYQWTNTNDHPRVWTIVTMAHMASIPSVWENQSSLYIYIYMYMYMYIYICIYICMCIYCEPPCCFEGGHRVMVSDSKGIP